MSKVSSTVLQYFLDRDFEKVFLCRMCSYGERALFYTRNVNVKNGDAGIFHSNLFKTE